MTASSRSLVSDRSAALNAGRGFSLAFVSIIAVMMAWSAYRNPAPTFDRFLYSAVAGKPIPITGNYPRAPQNDELAHAPEKIPQQFPMYANKPLFVLAVRFLPMEAVSPLCLIALALTLWSFTRSAWCLAVLLSPSVYGAAHQITPDLMAAVFIAGGAFACVRGKLSIGLGLLAISAWVRPENSLWLLMAAAILWFERKLRWEYAIAIAAVGALSTLTLAHFSYPWPRYLHRSLDLAILQPAEDFTAVSAHAYVARLASAIKGTVVMLAPWSLLGWVAWPKYSRWIVACYVFAFAHVVLLPIPEDRYLVACYVVIGALAIDVMLTGRRLLQPSGR